MPNHATPRPYFPQTDRAGRLALPTPHPAIGTLTGKTYKNVLFLLSDRQAAATVEHQVSHSLALPPIANADAASFLRPLVRDFEK